MTQATDVSAQSVLKAFVGCEQLTNKDLYRHVAQDLGLDPAYATAKAPVGTAQESHNLFHRRVRWHQQSLRKLGILQRMDRGTWGLTEKSKKELTPAPPKQVLIAFSTDLGVALWGNAEDVFAGLDEDITLLFTSPPYPLANQRQYGGVDQKAYVQWLCTTIEPIIKRLRPGGNVVLNLGVDIFEPGSPARSTYIERVTLALCDMGLSLMDRFIWQNPQRPPGPIQWASLKRVQCNAGYEVCLWLTNSPREVIADNRRVLEPHSEQHKRLIAKGGENRERSFSGGAYRLYKGSFGNATAGRIPRNILTIPHRDLDQMPAREFAKARGLPEHPAPMPTRLAEFFVQFLSEVGDLIVDPFGGMATTGRAAEIHSRRWLVTERCRQYIAAAAERFRTCAGYSTS